VALWSPPLAIPAPRSGESARNSRCLTQGCGGSFVRGGGAAVQGVKGREFDRVFVILDDSEARGFMFSYEKLLGAKPFSEEDKRKIAEGTETGINRSRRLLYVTCTRAKKSLALR
jgi:hypothetical protein